MSTDELPDFDADDVLPAVEVELNADDVLPSVEVELKADDVLPDDEIEASAEDELFVPDTTELELPNDKELSFIFSARIFWNSFSDGAFSVNFEADVFTSDDTCLLISLVYLYPGDVIVITIKTQPLNYLLMSRSNLHLYCAFIIVMRIMNQPL